MKCSTSPLLGLLLLALSGLAVLNASAAVAAPKPQTVATQPADDAVVARINGAPITESAVRRALEVQPAVSGTASPTPSELAAMRQAATGRLIAEELLWQEARKNKLDRHPMIEANLAAARRQAAIELYVRERLKVTPPSEDAITQRYRQIVDALGPREYRISLIQNPDETQIREGLRELRGGAEFAAVARKVSQAASAARGGELDWISFPLPATEGRTQGLPLAVARSLAEMTPGQISEPIRLADTWVLVRLDAARTTLVPAYDQVRDSLRSALLLQETERASRALVAELLSHAKLEKP